YNSATYVNLNYKRVSCRSSGLEPSSKVVSSLGGTTRSRGGRGVRRSACMFELWFREMEATTDPSSPAFLREVEAPSALPTLSALPMRNPKLLGQGYYCSFSAKLEVGGGVLVLMMKLSAEVKSVKSTIRWFSMRTSRVLSGSKAEVISAGRTMISLVVGSLVVSGEISMVVSAEALRVSELRRNERSGDLFRFLPESMKGKLRRRNACRSEWCRSSH
ncbi:hypothetical protein HID58_081083, partial [Brassica napus]